MKPYCQHHLPPGCCAICIDKARKRQAEYEALSQLTGRSIEELERDLTAPDPSEEPPCEPESS